MTASSSTLPDPDTLMHSEPAAKPFLSLVFPVFDEEANLPELLRTTLEIAPRLTDDYEVVLVDDGSRDRSGAIIDRWCRAHPQVRRLRHSQNRGYGAALRSGLREARGQLVFFSDADLQFDLSELEKLLEHTDRFDVVVGYRSPRRDPWHRRILAMGWGGIVRLLFGLRVRDIDCAFKVFHRRVIEAMPIESIGAFVNTEILLRARADGYRLHEVPVSHRRRQHGQQSGARPRVIARALAELVVLHRKLRDVRRGRGNSAA